MSNASSYVDVAQDITGGSSYDDALPRASKLLIGPNILGANWTPEQVWNTGFVDQHKENLAALSVEQYVPFLSPSNHPVHLRPSSYASTNCFAFTGTGLNISAQDAFPTFLNHTAATSQVAPYLNSAQIAQDAGKPLLMMETNSAACGGFPGLSDSFGEALWSLDYGLQMAYSNFSGAMFHVFGQNSSFNVSTLFIHFTDSC